MRGTHYTLWGGSSNAKVLTEHTLEQVERWPGREQSPRALLLDHLFMEDACRGADHMPGTVLGAGGSKVRKITAFTTYLGGQTPNLRGGKYPVD